MAVNPDYQIVFQEDLVKSEYWCHCQCYGRPYDVLGPTLQDIAQAFTATIPEMEN